MFFFTNVIVTYKKLQNKNLSKNDDFYLNFQLLTQESSSFTLKIADWWESVWNRFDSVAIFLAITALILRSHSNTFNYGRIAYSVNTTVFYTRLFRMYHVNYHLGPKLIIFYRMVR